MPSDRSSTERAVRAKAHAVTLRVTGAATQFLMKGWYARQRQSWRAFHAVSWMPPVSSKTMPAAIDTDRESSADDIPAFATKTPNGHEPPPAGPK